jgi:hypothetical protein
MTLQKLRRRWIVLFIVIALAFGEVLLLDARAPIEYYRVVDDHTLVVGAGTGPTFWAHVTSVSETESAVVVGVSSVRVPLPSTNDQITEVTVSLRDPIGDRALVDASSGLPVPAASPIDYYRVLDDHTLVVGAGTGPFVTVGLWALTETSSSVVVGVSSIRARLPSTGDTVVEVTASLNDPIGDRAVIDASSGLPVPRK